MKFESLMGVAGVALVTLFSNAQIATVPAVRYEGEKVVRVMPRSVNDLRLMDLISDDRWTCGAGGPGGEADYRVSAADLVTLDRAGVPYRVIIDDVQKLIEAERAEIEDPFGDRAFFDAYQNYASVSSYVDTLVGAYPGFVTRFSSGTSIQGRDIFGMRVTSPVPPIGGSPRKPVIYLNSVQHAREWISVMANMYVATQLLSTYSTDATAKSLLDTYEFVFIPISNPDGYNITWTSQRLWRKNARVINGVTRGVDMNRNWSVGYGLDSGSSSSPSNETYRGTGAFSEPETAAMRNYLLSIPKVAAGVDLHSYSQLVLRPWMYQNALPPGMASFNRIGPAMVAAIAAKTGATYTYGGPDILYLASGVASDWYFGALGAVGMGMELRDTGQNGFILPASQIVPTGQDAYAAITTMVTGLCRADLNRDNIVDDTDFVQFASAYDTFLTNTADFTGDGATDDFDFVVFADAYDRLTCP